MLSNNQKTIPQTTKKGPPDLFVTCMELIMDVFRPQHPGATISMIESGIASPALFTPNPSAPGELNASVAGEL